MDLACTRHRCQQEIKRSCVHISRAFPSATLATTEERGTEVQGTLELGSTHTITRTLHGPARTILGPRSCFCAQADNVRYQQIPCVINRCVCRYFEGFEASQTNVAEYISFPETANAGMRFVCIDPASSDLQTVAFERLFYGPEGVTVLSSQTGTTSVAQYSGTEQYFRDTNTGDQYSKIQYIW